MVPLRPDTEPAPTIGAAGLATGRDVWVQRERSGDRADEGFDPSESPAQALTSKTRSWTVHRPATAVCGDPRISPPGYRGKPEHYVDGKPPRSGDNAIRVSIEEASILQGFRPDYPWQGSRTKCFEQVGNAVPPPFARAVIAHLLRDVLAERKAA